MLCAHGCEHMAAEAVGNKPLEQGCEQPPASSGLMDQAAWTGAPLSQALLRSGHGGLTRRLGVKVQLSKVGVESA